MRYDSKASVQGAGPPMTIRAEGLLERVEAFDRGELEEEELVAQGLAWVVNGLEARRALVVVASDVGKQLYLIAASDEHGVRGMPLPSAAFSEFAEVAGANTVHVLRGVDPSSRVRPYLGSVDPSTVSLCSVALRRPGAGIGMLQLHLPDRAVNAEAKRALRLLAAVLTARVPVILSASTYADQTRKVSLSRFSAPPELLGKYEAYLERAAEGMVVVDAQGRVVYLNRAGEELSGYSSTGLRDVDLETLFVGEDRARVRQMLAAAGGGEQLRAEASMRTTSQDPLVVELATSAVFDEDDCTLLSFRDVTEARHLADQLSTTKQFLERLIDSTADAIIAADARRQIILFNKGAERLFDYRSEELVGQASLERLFPPGVVEELFEQIETSEPNAPHRVNLARRQIIDRRQRRIPVSLSISPMDGGPGSVGSVVVIRDLRERLRIERRLAEAQQRLVDSEKQALIAELAGTTAHELNQPLTSIMGYAELMGRRLAGDAANRQAAETIFSEGQRMAEIVRKIGRITRYETKAYVGATQILDLDKASD